MRKVSTRFLLTAILGVCSISSASAINLEFINSQTNSCAGAKVNAIEYISGNNLSKFIGDEFFSSNQHIISDGSTTVQMYRAQNSLVSNCTSASDWMRLSSYAPGGGQKVVALGTNCTFNKPTNKNKRNVQFVFKVGYYDIVSGPNTWNAVYYKNTTELRNNTPHYKLLSNVDVANFRTHANECLNVELRYCGDGIREPGNGETCDPEDPTQTGWGNGGCNTNTCQPINTPACNSLTVKPNSGDAPLDVTATCTGYKVDTWKIDCGNGQVFTGNGNNSGTQTFTKTCNYTKADEYTPRCTINGSITNNSCRKTVDVTNPDPSIIVDKKDANVFDLDNNVGNDTQTVYRGDEAVFKIRVRNNGEEALKNITLTDANAPACATKGGTLVDLDGKKFTNVNNNNVTITFGGSGNHSDNQLQVGEWFEYTCKKGNTQSNYTNTVSTSGVGVVSGIKVNDSDPTQIIIREVPDPEIGVDKRDENLDDLDGNIGGNDSQTVNIGRRAHFRITVTNTGNEDLKDIFLNDPQALACGSTGNVNLAGRYFTNSESYRVNISVFGAGNHSDNILQVGESFSYTCAKYNTQEAYTNVIFVQGTGITSGIIDVDDDPTEVLIATNPDIEVVKEDANSNDLDGVQFNDEQTVVFGTEAVFHITVRNTGDEDLINIDLDDAVAPACASDDYVDLANAEFLNEQGVLVPIYFDGAGNHSDNVFQVGEEFSYSCAKPNTTADYENTVEVTGEGETSGTIVDDEDDTDVFVNEEVYDLALIKTLSSSTPGPFRVGDDVTFNILVRNQGNVDSGIIEITDYIPEGLDFKNASITGTLVTSPNSFRYTIDNIETCGGDILCELLGINTRQESITFTINSAAPSTISNYAEISSDSGDDCDSTPDTNRDNDDLIDNMIENGCSSEEDEDDHDIETINLISDSYDLALRKILSTTTPGPFNTGDTVTFDIEVFNQGTQDAANIEVTDYIPTGLTLNDSNWTLSGDTAVRQMPGTISPGGSSVISIIFTIDTDAPRTVKNLAEISSDNGDDCDSTPDSIADNDGIITDNAIGVACDPGGDEDDHDIEEITIENSSDDDYDLALRKTLVGSDTVFAVGEDVTFNIEIFNQGQVDATNIVITDYIPTGLTLNDSNWTQSGNMATRVLSSLKAGESTDVTITFTLNSSATGTIRNIAEISDDDGNDCDSTTDTDSTNDALTDDEIGTRCDTNPDDEDDHDIAEITVDESGTSACVSLTASPTSAKNSLTSTLTCTGSGTITSYLLEVRDSDGNLEFTSNNATDTVTLNTKDTYTARCFVNGETSTPNSCRQTLQVTSGGGGSEPTCSDVIQDGSQITCVGNKEVEAFMLECQLADGTQSLLFDTTPTIINSKRREAVFTCATGIAECLVNGTATDDPTHPKWERRSSDVCTTNKVPFCGDGVLDSEAGEKCDFGSASDWGKCYKPPHSKACTWKTGGGGDPECDPEVEICNVITLPNDGELVFGPADEVIIGHGANPLDQTGTPYLQNNSEYDLSFDQFCIKRTSLYTDGDGGTDVVGAEKALESGNVAGEYCANIGHEVIYAYETITLEDYAIYPNYTGNKSGIPAAADYGKAKLKTSIKADIDNNGTIDELYDSYLSSELRVRVAKPAVVTTGGGVSYVKDTTTGDVEKVTTGVSSYNQDNNKNFVGTSASDSGVSSHSDSLNTTDDAEGVNKIGDEKDVYEQAVDSVTDTSIAVGNVTGYGDFKNYNGLSNVFIVTGKNVTVTNIPSLGEPTTYIIEGGDLRINGNIETNQNVAFVVKGGDIIIDETVDRIDGTYISIPTVSGGGHINGDADTDTQLVVNGSLYGDISGLVLTRHYISNDSGQLSVGTIVAFGSSLFTKPAPLVSQFIGEYLEAEKVAQ